MDKINFTDIAGYEDEKKEAMKIVNWLKNYQLYKNEGAYLPKGLLLCGAPGVGKTMLAKAIATESGAYFVDVKLSGVAKLNDTISQFQSAFKEAKNHVPSILFLDELDQLIGISANFDSDERRRMVDVLLTELDGSTSSAGVIVIATCNRRNTLPQALLRSGRMDQHIVFELPDDKDREAIFKLYFSKNHRFDKVNVKPLITMTRGLHCADLKSICNSVLINCIDNNKEFAENKDFESIINSIQLHDIDRINEKKDFNPAIAYHELSHFAVFYHYTKSPCQLRIDVRGGASGLMNQLYSNKSNKVNYDTYVQDIDVNLAGKIGEELFAKTKSIGCINDLSKAHDLYLRIACNNACFGYDLYPVFPSELGPDGSQAYMQRLEDSFTKFMNEREAEIKKILMSEKPLIDYLFPILMKNGRIPYRSMIYHLKQYKKLHPED